MKSHSRLIIAFLLIGFLFSQSIWADTDQYAEETFKNIELIKLKTLCGSVTVNRSASDDVKVLVVNDCRPRKACEIKIRNRNTVLYLEEHIRGSCNGCSHWTLSVPDNIEISYVSTSGSMEVSDLECTITGASTSGSFEIENCRGIFEIASTSGNINVYNVILDDYSSFGSTSGDVMVELHESSKYDLNVGSTSGEAVLDYNGNPFVGQFELTAKKRSGKIVCSEDFDDVDNFEKKGQSYVKKSFKRQSRDPFIRLGTSSGKVVLK